MQRPRRGLAVLAQVKGPEIGEARIGSRHGGRMRRRRGRVKGVGDRAYGTRRTFKDRAAIPSRLREGQRGLAACLVPWQRIRHIKIVILNLFHHPWPVLSLKVISE